MLTNNSSVFLIIFQVYYYFFTFTAILIIFFCVFRYQYKSFIFVKIAIFFQPKKLPYRLEMKILLTFRRVIQARFVQVHDIHPTLIFRQA